MKNFLFIGVAPLIGALGLFYLLYESVGDLSDPKASYSGSEVFGVGVPLAIAIIFIGLGLILMVAWRLIGPPAGREFFARRAFEAVPHEVATGEVAQVEAIGVSEAEADAGAVAHRRGGPLMATLVVGYDGSECARAALDAALELAKGLGDDVVVAFGYDPGGPGEEYQAPATRCARSASASRTRPSSGPGPRASRSRWRWSRSGRPRPC